MSKTLRNMSLAFALMVFAAPMLGTEVQAKDSFMKVCSTKFKAAKAAGTPEGNMKWTDFMKSQCAADAEATAPATAAPAATAMKAKAKTAATTVATPSGSFMQNCSASWKEMKAAGTTPAGMDWKAFIASKCIVPASATAPADTAATGGTFMQKCSASWKAMKDAGSVPAGMDWKAFIASKCAVAGVAAPAPTPVSVKKKKAVVEDTMDPTPNEPDATMANQEPLKTVDKNGKAFTPGQMAAHQRARDCGGKWRANKPAFQAQYGTWPKYWSACNAEMKAAAGQ